MTRTFPENKRHTLSIWKEGLNKVRGLDDRSSVKKITPIAGDIQLRTEGINYMYLKNYEFKGPLPPIHIHVLQVQLKAGCPWSHPTINLMITILSNV